MISYEEALREYQDHCAMEPYQGWSSCRFETAVLLQAIAEKFHGGSHGTFYCDNDKFWRCVQYVVDRWTEQ